MSKIISYSSWSRWEVADNGPNHRPSNSQTLCESFVNNIYLSSYFRIKPMLLC
jgi:hypothetical protein